MSGLTDDEAYYWVLAQRPALGYAFHPPAVAWFISLSQILFGWLLGTHSSAVVRLPAALSIATMVWIGSKWSGNKAGLICVSFAGFFALSWMMVPDTPLFLGWMTAFYGTWRLVAEPSKKNEKITNALIFSGCALALLAKYSGGLVAVSSIWSILIWTRGRKRKFGLCAAFLGMAAALGSHFGLELAA